VNNYTWITNIAYGNWREFWDNDRVFVGRSNIPNNSIRRNNRCWNTAPIKYQSKYYKKKYLNEKNKRLLKKTRAKKQICLRERTIMNEKINQFTLELDIIKDTELKKIDEHIKNAINEQIDNKTIRINNSDLKIIVENWLDDNVDRISSRLINRMIAIETQVAATAEQIQNMIVYTVAIKCIHCRDVDGKFFCYIAQGWLVNQCMDCDFKELR